MSDIATNKQLERIEVLLSKSLVGEQFINTQFHIYSARSALGRVAKPRTLSVNDTLLANESKYFADLLSSDGSLFDPTMVDIPDVDEVPSEIDDYEYDSDSDLEDDDPAPFSSTREAEPRKADSHPRDVGPAGSGIRRAPSTVNTTASTDDDTIEDDGSDAIDSDIFLVDRVPVMPTHEESATGSDASHDSQEEEKASKGSISRSVVAAHARYPEVRHILVKNTAFRTWYALLSYLYTGRITFTPLKSPVSSTSHASELSCSAKSMHRLANKVGLDELSAKALEYIRGSLSEHNILNELSCSLLSSHPQLLEVELGALNCYINTPPVATGFSSFARRIANKEFSRGSEIIIFITSKLLEARSDGTQKPEEARASSQSLQPNNPAEVVQRIADRLADMFSPHPNAKKTSAVRPVG